MHVISSLKRPDGLKPVRSATEIITTVFVEQLLALPGLLKNKSLYKEKFHADFSDLAVPFG